MMDLFMKDMLMAVQGKQMAMQSSTTANQKPTRDNDGKDDKKTKRKSKRSKLCSETKIEGATSAIEDEGSDSSVEQDTYVSENTCRRANWQKGRQDWSRPSKIAAEVKKVTVETLPEVNNILRKHGWAILRDVTTAFGPKAQFTREQRNYITKCKNYLIYSKSHAVIVFN
jgi:hypothetical protein